MRRTKAAGLEGRERHVACYDGAREGFLGLTKCIDNVPVVLRDQTVGRLSGGARDV